jgi:hypothetical protein
MRPEVVFSLVLILAVAVIVGGLYLRFRNLQMLHVERMAAMDKGTTIPVWRSRPPWSPRVYFLRGLLWGLGGAALSLSLFGIAGSTHQPERPESVMRQAKDLSDQVAIPLDEARKIIDRDREHRTEGMPSAIALLGFIPVGIGLAYLLFYFTDDSRYKQNTGAEERVPSTQY